MNTYLTIFGKPRYLGILKITNKNLTFDESGHEYIVIKTFRGLEIGLGGGKLSDEQLKRFRSSNTIYHDSSESILQRVEFVRKATQEDLENYYLNRQDEEQALLVVRKILQNHALNMKIIDVEYMLDRKKFYCYFFAERRVDFRMYVRDVAYNFHTRIEMRQLGRRDEARIVRGISSCGRPCCCSYWLHGFMPVSIKTVKEQRSALNPIKISGMCGRLMCCMAYEKNCYAEVWEKLLPAVPGTKIKTEQGFYILEGIELGRERVNIRFPNGRVIAVPIAEFENFKEIVLKGEEWGEDRELAEKKKAAAERIAILKARAERRKSRKPAAAPALNIFQKTAAPSQANKPKQPKKRYNKRQNSKHQKKRAERAERTEKPSV